MAGRLSLFSKSPSKHSVIGVQINADGVALAQVLVSEEGPLASAGSPDPEVRRSEWLPEADANRQRSLLEDRVNALGLKRQPCNLVLSSEDYSLLLVEAPAVPANELRDALRWRIRDLIDFPVDQAVLDAFLLPEDRTRGGKRMAYVAVTQRELIRQRVEQMESVRLDLRAIDIPEMTRRNIAIHLCDTSRGMALVKLGPGAGSLHIVRGDDLHLARRFNLPYEGGLLDDLPADVLVLELQRSLDYFERQMRQPPPGHIYLVGENVTADKITDAISSGLPMEISLLDMEAGLTLSDQVQEHTLPLCLDALGAALRSSGTGER